MRTRSSATQEPSTESKTTKVTRAMERSDDPHPPKMFILPKGGSNDARVVTLANPRTSLPNRYYFCPEKGVYEFTKIAAPRSTPRSILLAPKHHKVEKPQDKESSISPSKEEQESTTEGPIATHVSHKNGDPVTSNGYVTKDADVFVATPLDPLFLILPALCPSQTKDRSDPPKQMFLSADDYIETLADKSKHFAQITKAPFFRQILESRMAAACDTVDAGDEKMYRLNNDKLLQELLVKAHSMVQRGLPSSMEDKFVTRALEAPVMSIKREDTTVSVATSTSNDPKALGSAPGGRSEESASVSVSTTMPELASPSSSFPSGTQTPADSAEESQVSSATSLSVETESPSSTSTGPDPHILHLLRLRISLDFLLASYVPAHIVSRLNSLLSADDPITLSATTSPYFAPTENNGVASGGSPEKATTTTISFAPLTAHLAHLAALRQQAQASRSLGDFSRKRTFNGGGGEDDESAEIRAEKKRKKDEEEKKRRAGESRALRDLKKVDTSGMKKLSDFFVKKQPAGGTKGKTK
ncbi:hypothetical protein L228DRAFT_285691 [Xylona heveae TC161]|uniref:Ribonuclease H2 subunit B n=1 Tax=Xylona heveae (strain CBS 132557 / TC161) TaxID=1328760 RepID=A0A164ZZX7_XYLHT|nr:hypothetical protein L228DRAFT_285691 [Xylona heveae TC161]KZF19754.1 hypothetical protein L228DRAFT_285691 [Xylona heveae TC161]